MGVLLLDKVISNLLKKWMKFMIQDKAFKLASISKTVYIVSKIRIKSSPL